ncbi:MAG: hypothetical protein JW712_13655 [Dehalococcoidales bacterium]|nr:hypothetical protein [Dehalococcoidales bacterium]
MRKKTFRVVISLIVFVLSLIPSGCSSDREEGFAIYLTKNDIKPDQMIMMSHIELADEPLISEKDIISYDAVTHEIRLTSDSFERISQLQVPVSGKSFLVCINKSPVYGGAFWTPVSSQSFSGITIMQPLGSPEPIIRIFPGYPSEGFYSGSDPRNNTDAMEALKKSGKLVNETPVTIMDELPRSMKGYELYSWKEKDEWQFRLITGTNRNKTFEEIVSGKDSVSDLISIHVTGTDAIESVLAKVPANEFVIWLDRITDGTTGKGEISIGLPEKTIVERIMKRADTGNFELAVPSRD